MATNSFEAHARMKKAHRIATFIWDRLEGWEKKSASLPTTVGLWTKEEREIAATAAGQHKPSDETWAVVVKLLHRWMVEERFDHRMTGEEVMRAATRKARARRNLA